MVIKYNKNFPKVDSNHTSLAIISLDSTVRKNGNYYLQVLFLKKCQYIEKKVIRFIDKDMKLMFVEKTIFKNVFFEGAILKMYFRCFSS